MSKIKMTPSEAMVETLLAEGVRHVTGIVGSAFMDLLDLFPTAGIEFLPVRHEQSAGHMEDAFCRVTGQCGVIMGQNGPGITNMVTSVAAANMAHTPLVVICPSAGTPSVGWDGFQEADTVQIFKAITKATIRVPHPMRAADCLRNAFRIAYAERGAVLLDIPRDYFYGEFEEEILEPHQYRVDKRGAGDPADIEKAIALLEGAKNPVIISGRGVVDTQAWGTVASIAEKLTAPVVCTYLHNDAFPCDHPLWMGPIGYMGSKSAMLTLSEADVMLAVGTRLSVFGTVPQNDIDYFPSEAKIIQIDINPRHIGRTHPVELGMIADAGEATKAIDAGLKALPFNEERMALIKERQDAWEKEIYDLAMEPGDPMNPRRALLEICKVLPEDAIVCTDIGNVSSTMNSYLKCKGEGRHIAALTFGNTGFAYPAALGAQLAKPDAPVVAIVGDGAWGMSLHEVSTAVEHNIPAVAIVFRNGAWCAEKKNQIDFYNNRFIGCDIPNPKSFAPVAEAMEAVGISVSNAEDVGPALKAALESRKPTVLEICCDGTQLAPPFRKDALKLPTRLLPKYQNLDYHNWAGMDC